MKDLELADLRVAEVAFVDDMLTFRFNLIATGYAGKRNRSAAERQEVGRRAGPADGTSPVRPQTARSDARPIGRTRKASSTYVVEIDRAARRNA